jgi:hypothetical protein
MVDTPSRYNRISIPDDIYSLRLESLDLSVRLFNLLHRAGICLVGHLLEMDLDAFHQLPLGEKSREEVIHRIQTLDLLPEKQEALIETPQEETAIPATNTTPRPHRRPLPSRFAYAVATREIPGRYRSRLPYDSRICFLEEPTPLCDDPDTYAVRIAMTPAALTASKAIHLRITDEKQSRELAIFQRLTQDATTHPQALTASQIRVAPSPFLPKDCVEICHRPAITMLEHEEVLIPDLFYLEETGITRISPQTGDLSQLVNISELPERLTSHQSGPVYSVWMPQARIAQSPVYDDELASLDTHDRRIQVVETVRDRGGTIPTSIEGKDTLSAKEDVVAITQSTLQEDFQLVSLKDPIFLRKEDVCKENAGETDEPHDLLEKDPVNLLEKAAHAVSEQHETLVAQMSQRIEQFELAETSAEQKALLEQQRQDQHKAERLEILRGWLEETMIWYTSQSRKRWLPITEITPVLLRRCSVPVRDEDGKRMYATDEEWAYLLTVSVPTTLSLPAKLLVQKRKKSAFRAPDPIIYGSKPPVIVPKSVQGVAA